MSDLEDVAATPELITPEHTMLCTCDIEGVREVMEQRLRVFHRMGMDDTSYFATAVILSLAFDFGAEASVAADMWFGVGIESEVLGCSGYVECDWPLDGLVWLWEKLANKYPERVSVNPYRSERKARVEERVSTTLLDNYECAAMAYQEQKTAHEAVKLEQGASYHWCDDCTALLALKNIAHATLDREWGSAVLEPAILAAYGE